MVLPLAHAHSQGLESESLDEGSGSMRAVMCMLFGAGWFPVHPSNWKEAGVAGVYWPLIGAGNSAETIELSRDGQITPCMVLC